MLKKAIDYELKSLYRFRIFVVFLCTINTLLGLIPPYIMGILINDLLIDMNQIVFLSLLIIILIFVKFITNWMQNFLWFKMVFEGTAIVRSYVFSSLLKKSSSFFTDIKQGDIINRVVNDSNTYAENRLILMPILFLNIVTLFGVIAFLISMDFILTVVMIICMTVYFFVYRNINVMLRNNMKKERESYSALMNSANETLQGIDSIHLFRSEAFFTERFKSSAINHSKFLINLQFWKSLGLSSNSFILGLMPIISLVIGVQLLLRGHINIGTIISFYSLLPYVGEPIRNLTDFNNTIQQASVVETRLENLLPSDETKVSSTNYINVLESISLNNICFGYNDMSPLFHNISFDLKKGDRLAVSGISGSGKTTLIKLLLGQLAQNDGDILINSNALQSWDYDSYLKRIAILPQDMFLFDGTIDENIAFGYQCNSDEIVKAKELSCLNDISEKISVKGLSGGERQRVGLARALLRDIDILILDEPTSALDKLTEKKIIQNIDELSKEKQLMLVIVSHRPDIMKICNKKFEYTENGQWEYRSCSQQP